VGTGGPSNAPFGPIQLSVRGYHQAKREARSDKARGAPGGYVVIVRGADGRLRSERFNDVAAYRARLMSLKHSEHGSISIEEIAELLDS
jgi:hypothetical protein